MLKRSAEKRSRSGFWLLVYILLDQTIVGSNTILKSFNSWAQDNAEMFIL